MEKSRVVSPKWGILVHRKSAMGKMMTNSGALEDAQTNLTRPDHIVPRRRSAEQAPVHLQAVVLILSSLVQQHPFRTAYLVLDEVNKRCPLCTFVQCFFRNPHTQAKRHPKTSKNKFGIAVKCDEMAQQMKEGNTG